MVGPVSLGDVTLEQSGLPQEQQQGMLCRAWMCAYAVSPLGLAVLRAGGFGLIFV